MYVPRRPSRAPIRPGWGARGDRARAWHARTPMHQCRHPPRERPPRVGHAAVGCCVFLHENPQWQSWWQLLKWTRTSTRDRCGGCSSCWCLSWGCWTLVPPMNRPFWRYNHRPLKRRTGQVAWKVTQSGERKCFGRDKNDITTTFTSENVGPASNGWSTAYWNALKVFRSDEYTVV